MPKLRDYMCTCGNRFEYMHMDMDTPDIAACPACGRCATERDEMLGGRSFSTIIPMYPGSLRQKAGYVHTHGDRPAEKGSVAVPRNKGEM
jgi:hypothetical protein